MGNLNKTFEELQDMADFKEFGLMKCTLRKVAEGIVATVDQRPKLNDYYFDIMFQDWVQDKFNVCSEFNDTDLYKIIASTFGVGKELVIQNLNFEIENLKFHSGLILMMQHEYTETEKQIIINL